MKDAPKGIGRLLRFEELPSHANGTITTREFICGYGPDVKTEDALQDLLGLAVGRALASAQGL
jgi:hypothetical protein